MAQLPSQTLRRALIPNKFTSRGGHQIRHASLLKRPKRPYTFTQLVVLSDGSTYTQRTTSPKPVYKSAKDTRNHPLWQPSMSNLQNIEEDDAGRLKSFRRKYGRGWDVEASEGSSEGGAKDDIEAQESLMDLISGYSAEEEPSIKPKKSSAKSRMDGTKPKK